METTVTEKATEPETIVEDDGGEDWESEDSDDDGDGSWESESGSEGGDGEDAELDDDELEEKFNQYVQKIVAPKSGSPIV